jgi:putative transposase
MTAYRRFRHPGGVWFFTVNLVERRGNRLLTDRIDELRAAFAEVKAKRPYDIDAVVVLPDHLHCVLTLPEDDADFSTRWGLIKAYFSRHMEKGERVSQSRQKRGERGIWQRRLLRQAQHRSGNT